MINDNLLMFTDSHERELCSLERAGLTFGFVARIISPDGGAGAIDGVLQGHDIG